jgi:DNA-binding GntR family transcriptional regulator
MESNHFSSLQSPKHRTLRTFVVEELTRSILSGEIPPGARLNETELAERFGLSRSPIREALRQLEQSGLIINQPNSMTLVAPLSYDEFEQLYQIRSALEPLIVRYAVLNATDEDIQDLRRMLDGMSEVLENDRLPELAALDVRFHSAVLNCAHRPRIAAVLSQILQQSRRYIAITNQALSLPSWKQIVYEHRRVYDYIAARDPQAAERAMQEHLSEGSARMLALIQQQIVSLENTPVPEPDAPAQTPSAA